MESDLAQIAKKLVAPTKGILAADESLKTIEKRFAPLGIESTEETRRLYRNTLITTAGVENYLSGIILFEETAHQKNNNGIPFPTCIKGRGMLAGVKVDGGLEDFGEVEKVTKGLDGLKEKLREYREMGLVFTKWRAAFTITDIYPSKECVEENLNRMVEFVVTSISSGLVPIVEPEVLMDGTHTTTRCAEITSDILQILFQKLANKGINFKEIILKVNMVLPGKDGIVRAEPLEVAGATLRVLKKNVPEDLGGVVFLSGGQTPVEATKNLNEIEVTDIGISYPLSFSFARALQSEALEIWAGKEENVKNAQEVFLNRCKLVSLARQGKYTPDMEN